MTLPISSPRSHPQRDGLPGGTHTGGYGDAGSDIWDFIEIEERLLKALWKR